MSARACRRAAVVQAVALCVLSSCDSTVELPPPRHDVAVDSRTVVPDTSFDPIDTAEQDVLAIDTAPPSESGVVDAGLDAVHANYAFCIERLPYEDHTADREVIVDFGGDYGELYLPRCIVIRSGTVVTFVVTSPITRCCRRTGSRLL